MARCGHDHTAEVSMWVFMPCTFGSFPALHNDFTWPIINMIKLTCCSRQFQTCETTYWQNMKTIVAHSFSISGQFSKQGALHTAFKLQIVSTGSTYRFLSVTGKARDGADWYSGTSSISSEELTHINGSNTGTSLTQCSMPL